ncbi:MAG: UDP-glucose 4-epimerase GalE [Clostridiales Family XIII bacterium]|jgi:UDP-glucose 4-epimerase|nr:UDP-glucose 4-epimerase GalE [Clostridiales Family XIII bacterium]
MKDHTRNKTVLLTGGAGFIGSHTATVLLDRGYDVVLLDNFSNSKRDVPTRIEKITGKPCPCEEADLLHSGEAEAAFKKHDIGSVIHFAGLKAVGESVEKPLEYYENNLLSTINLLGSMRTAGVKNLIFSSSATVYKHDNPVPYYENFPLGAANPYGWTKVMIERIIMDTAATDFTFSAALLRYFNPIGAHQSGLIGEDPQGIPNNLLPYIAKVATGELPEVRIFGDNYDTPDGTGVRDYIHIMDLAEGHLLAMEYLRKKRSHEGDFIDIGESASGAAHEGANVHAFNLGTGKGTSVREIISAFERACGRELPKSVYPRRAGDLAIVYANTDLAERELGFKARLGIDEMCADAWRWQRHCAKLPE